MRSQIDFGNCQEELTDSIVVYQEKGKSFRVLNSNRQPIGRIRADGCLNINGNKCDFLAFISPTGTLVFIELKGTDIEHAATQLQNTIRVVMANSSWIKVRPTRLEAFVIASLVPSTSSRLQRMKTQFFRDFGINLQLKKNTFEYQV